MGESWIIKKGVILLNIPIGVQMYTLREETSKDFIGTLEKVAEIGYKGVEFAGYGGLSAAELKANLDRLGLTAISSHVSKDRLQNNLEEEIEFNLAIGSKYIVFPYIKYKDKEDYLEAAKFYNEVGQKCKEKGLEFLYHNHDFEFDLFDGEHALDILFNETDKEFMKAELDTYWVKYAGVDPIEYMGKYSGRCPLVHIKDMAGDESRAFTEIGNGIIDIKAIVEAAKEGGATWAIVEQDVCQRPPLQSIKISFENLKKLNLV